MEIIPFTEGSLYGVKTAEKILLYPQFEDINIYVFNKSGEIKMFNPKYPRKGLIERVRERLSGIKLPDDDNDPSIQISLGNDVIFLVKKSHEFYLLKLGFNLSSQRIGVYQLFTKFSTLESFLLGKRDKEMIKEEPKGIKIFGKYYDVIEYLGSTFFKVRIIEVYRVLEPIDDNGNEAWKTYTDNFYWQIIDSDGNLLSNKRFQNIKLQEDGTFKVTINNSERILDSRGALV